MAEIDVRQLPQLWNTACACMKNKDYVNAAKLMKVLSCEGYSEAQYYLGWLYLNGLAVEKNLTEAFRLLSSAAHNGHAAAQCRLAGMYASGTHVAKDVLAAAWWLLRSAVRGNAEAQFNLGRMFAAGIGVDKNAAEAIWWLHAAAEQGNANAKALLEKSNNPKARPATLQDAAVHTLRELAKREYPYAMWCLGEAYFGGTLYCGGSLPQDEAEAQRWYQKAFPLMKKLAEQGEAEAQMRLFQMYRFGAGVAEDGKEDWRWLNTAAENGYAEAQETLGMNMRRCNTKEAIRWWTSAARQGNPRAQYYLSNEPTCSTERRFWLIRSAEQGDSVAQHQLCTQPPYYISDEAVAYWKEKYQKQKERAFIERIDL